MSPGQSNGQCAVTLRTERLKLRLADPTDDADCQEIISLYNDQNAGKGGNSKIGIKTIADVREKHRVCGPRSEYCTLAPPPSGMFFLAYLPSAEPGGHDTLIGNIALSFRPEMPYPDLGYGILGPYERQGFATEAGRKALQFWRDVIGVKELWCGTLPGNERSQRCAERIGFVRAGNFDVVFGQPPDEERVSGAVGFVLPGMKWTDGLTIYPTIH